jgi:Ras-related protein Rab-6A
VPRWIDFVRENRGQDALIYLVGNKIDVEHPEVEMAAAVKVCQEMHLNWEEVSAKSGKNILQLFRKVTKSLSTQEEDEQEEITRKVELVPDSQKNQIKGNGCRC